MRLLVISQRVDRNDDVLGFFHEWLREFSKQADQVIALCLEKGQYDLPANTKVLSLGKEIRKSRWFYIRNFYRHIFRLRSDYDAVFVHMNPEYMILGGLLWWLWGKKRILWYAHGHVSRALRFSVPFAQVILTSTSGGCRIESQKVKVIGQGIDTSFFVPNEHPTGRPFQIISIGRISPVKGLDTLIEAVDALAQRGADIFLTVVGKPGLDSHKSYLIGLKHKVMELGLQDKVRFVGAVPNMKTKGFLEHSNLFVNASQTGSLDKAVLEAMSAGLPVVTSNEALSGVLGNYRDTLMFPPADAPGLVERIEFVMKMNDEERNKLGEGLREIVVRDHNLSGFVNKIILAIRAI